MTSMFRKAFGSALDALVIGVGGGAFYWVLWQPSVATAIVFAVVGGSLTAVLMRVGRNTTPGDLLLQRFLGSRR